MYTYQMQPTVHSEVTQTKLSGMVTHADPKSTLSQISRVMTIQYLPAESRLAATSCRNSVKAIRCFCELKKKRQLKKLWHSSFSLCVLSCLKKKRKKRKEKPLAVSQSCFKEDCSKECEETKDAAMALGWKSVKKKKKKNQYIKDKQQNKNIRFMSVH